MSYNFYRSYRKFVMSGVTVSAHTSQEIVARLDAIAKAERRNRSQVVGMALDLFVELPPSVREAWLKLSSTGSEQQMKALMDNIARTIVDARYQIAHDRVIAEMNIEHLEPLATEDDILAAAVNLTERK
jgi:predicted transcriptional regulator